MCWENSFPGDTFQILLLIFITVSTTVHQTKTMCPLYDLDLYVQCQGRRPQSKGNTFLVQNFKYVLKNC